jgi:hypothetical protein
VQVISEVLTQQVATTKAWPTAIDVDPETNVIFEPYPACQALGVLPTSTELRYGTSPDEGQIALAIWDAKAKVGTIWRSVDDTVYEL